MSRRLLSQLGFVRKRDLRAAPAGEPQPADNWQLEENEDAWLLEDGSGVWLLEEAA